VVAKNSTSEESKTMTSISIALTNMRRSPYQTMASIMMMAITFFVGYAFSLFFYGTAHILQYFEQQPQAIAFFELDATSSQIDQAQKTMTGKPYVTEVTVVSKEQALDLYRQANQKDPLLLELVTAEILHASIDVKGKDLEALGQIKSDLEKLPGVDDVALQQDVVEQLSNATNSLRYAGIGAIAVLALTTFLIISVVTSLKITNKRNAIQIMRIIGASAWFIKAPFLYEGMMYGLVGSLIGWVAMYIGLLYCTPWLNNFLGAVPLLPFSPQVLLIQVSTGTIIGMLLGGLASTMAAQRVMRH
jgi:cell division transport system permease protein